jgi:prepilin-type N-terminal cleavage/methylation domain-containing protein
MFSKSSRGVKEIFSRENRVDTWNVSDSPQHWQRGFSMIEMVVVIAILLILAGITAPKILGMIETQRLQSTTRAYASFLQESRYRAEQAGQWSEVLFDTTDPSVPIAYLDLNGDNQRQTSEPSMQVPAPIRVPDPAGMPSAITAGFSNASLLGAIPLTVDNTPATWNQQGQQIAGLAFNERGLPCQRTSATAACTNSTVTNVNGTPAAAPVAWVTYFAYPTSNGGTLYSAVTVTPAGRIKVWNYQSNGGGGGTWQ